MNEILVVDDMAIVREPLAATLRHAGFNVACACDGDTALAAVKKRRPDLILLDITMPGMDGLGFLGSLRRDCPAGKDIKVMVLSASSDKVHIVRAAQLGIHDYLLKSQFSLPDLLNHSSLYWLWSF